MILATTPLQAAVAVALEFECVVVAGAACRYFVATRKPVVYSFWRKFALIKVGYGVGAGEGRVGAGEGLIVGAADGTGVGTGEGNVVPNTKASPGILRCCPEPRGFKLPSSAAGNRIREQCMLLCVC